MLRWPSSGRHWTWRMDDLFTRRAKNVRHQTEDPGIVGSNPTRSIIFYFIFYPFPMKVSFILILLRNLQKLGPIMKKNLRIIQIFL